MKCSLGIPNLLEEISGLSHSIVFLYFFALITEEGFLISRCYSLKLCIQMGISFIFSFAFGFSSFHSYLQGLLRQPFCFFAFLFLGDGLDPCLLFITGSHLGFNSKLLGTLDRFIHKLKLHSQDTCQKFSMVGKKNSNLKPTLNPMLYKLLSFCLSPSVSCPPLFHPNMTYKAVSLVLTCFPSLSACQL